MFCSLSGSVPIHPVVTPSGHVYEKELLLKALQETGKDPISGLAVTADQLVEIQQTNKVVTPRPPTANSVPSLLHLLQSEWDSVMLEAFHVKQQNSQLRQELAASYYELDAAKRVIARVVKERDEAKDALTQLRQSIAEATSQQGIAGEDEMEVDNEGKMPAEVTKVLETTSQALSKSRIKRKKPPTLATAEQIKSYTPIHELTSLHAASNFGILNVDLFCGDFGGARRDWAVTAGKDGQSHVIDIHSEKVVASVKSGPKKVTAVAWYNTPISVNYDAYERRTGMFFTGGVDKMVKYFKVSEVEEEGKKRVIESLGTVKAHEEGEIVSVCVHPSGDYLFSAASEGWSVSDIGTLKLIQNVKNKTSNSPLTTLKVHPDGLIMGTGSQDSVVHIWDIRQHNHAPVQTFRAHRGFITDMSFSENGYYLSTASSEDPIPKVWDLRERSALETPEMSAGSNNGVQRVIFDYAGKYLAFAAETSVRVYNNKSWTLVNTFEGYHTASILGLKFGTDAKYILSTGMDRKMVVLGLKE